MNASDSSSPVPPQNPPKYLLYLLGLPSDASPKELQDAWNEQSAVIENGPEGMFYREMMQLMRAGIPADKVQLAFKGTSRGQFLWNSMQREAAARQRQQASQLLFVKKLQKR